MCRNVSNRLICQVHTLQHFYIYLKFSCGAHYLQESRVTLPKVHLQPPNGGQTKRCTGCGQYCREHVRHPTLCLSLPYHAQRPLLWPFFYVRRFARSFQRGRTTVDERRHSRCTCCFLVNPVTLARSRHSMDTSLASYTPALN